MKKTTQMYYRAVNDGKRCAWCGKEERDHYPMIPLGLENPVWVHHKSCSEKYVEAKRQQAAEEDRKERPYMYPKSRWK